MTPAAERARVEVIALAGIDEVRAGESLEDRFVSLVGAAEVEDEELSWYGG